MKPLQLNLTNFLSYGQAEVPLSDVHVASLLGENGAGKSSLLDSITFAFYGEGRYKDIDRYIRQGQEQATVELEFALNEDIYRIIRGRSNKGKGKSTVELAKWVDGKWDPQSGASIRETDQKIRDLLKMDYDTFVSSCFMLQGKSDRFSSSQPADRKRILSQILGLEVYEKLQEAASLKAKSLNAELEKLKDKQDDLQKKLAEMPALTSRKDALTNLIADKQTELKKHQADMDEATQLHAKLQAKLDAYPTLVEEDDRLKAEIVSIQEELQAFEKQVETARTVLEHEEQILAKVKELETARERIAVLDTKLQQLKSLEDETSQVMHQRQQARESLEKANGQIAQLQVALSRRDELEKATAEYRELTEDLAALDTLEAIWKAAGEKVTAAEIAYNNTEKQFRFEKEALNKQIEFLSSKVDMLSNSNCIDPEKATCRFLADAQEAKVKLAKVSGDLEQLQKTQGPEVERLHELFLQAKEERTALDYNEQDHRIKKARAQTLRPLADEAAALSGKAELLENLKQQAAQLKDTTETLDTRFKKLYTEMQDLGDAKTELAKLQASLPLLEKWAAGKDKLPAARQILFESEGKRRKFQAQIDGKESRRTELQVKFRELSELSKQIEKCKSDMNGCRFFINVLTDELTQLQRDLGMVEQQLTGMDAAKIEAEAFTAKATDLAKQYTLYVTLVQAFGKNGIPALIIENALPEIEDISNDLLSRLTNGRMSVEMVTQKENKSGTVSETLDIYISDELGTRPYEGWSGAEKFKVDISNSLATSKFLARRAGTKIETLVLDENASCLDQDGRIKFIEAINTIAEDFAKIICISHIDELKEAFPQQILVRKTPEGSRVEVVA